MLDKFLTGENVKVNCEIDSCRHILRTLKTMLGKFLAGDFIAPI
jgi:hypothetical protein